MPKAPFGDLLRFIHAACVSQGTCDLADHELLARFVEKKGQASCVPRDQPLTSPARNSARSYRFAETTFNEQG